MNTEISGMKTMELGACLRKMFCDNSLELRIITIDGDNGLCLATMAGTSSIFNALFKRDSL